MNNFNNAISIAIEKGGYLAPPEPTVSFLVLDPLFWQSLGKALGHGIDGKEYRWWHNKAMGYFDLVLTGGDTFKFWEELL